MGSSAWAGRSWLWQCPAKTEVARYSSTKRSWLSTPWTKRRSETSLTSSGALRLHRPLRFSGLFSTPPLHLCTNSTSCASWNARALNCIDKPRRRNKKTKITSIAAITAIQETHATLLEFASLFSDLKTTHEFTCSPCIDTSNAGGVATLVQRAALPSSATVSFETLVPGRALATTINTPDHTLLHLNIHNTCFDSAGTKKICS